LRGDTKKSTNSVTRHIKNFTQDHRAEAQYFTPGQPVLTFSKLHVHSHKLTDGIFLLGDELASSATGAVEPLGSMVLFATLSGRFFLNLASIDDSRSGNGGISSKMVALRKE
jgi:hypothetical protein